MTPDPTPTLVGRRYQLVDHVGTGGMGIVYRAVDRLTGQVIALKRVITHAESDLHHSTSEAVDLRIALAQEFRLMASLRHPNIIRVLDYGFDDGHLPFYTMDLIDRAATAIEAGREQPFERQVELFVQLLQALAYLHRRGIIHRDLKPKNVLVDGSGIKVLDFGLSILRGQAARSEGTTVGTLGYMAPEVILGSPATEASDLYAVGVMGFELFTGVHPYAAMMGANGQPTPATIKHILQSPPDLFSGLLDDRLVPVIGRLLSKSPADRFGSVSETLDELFLALGQTVALETAATRESFLQAARLVGREAEVSTLTAALHDTIQGHGSSWLIGGESGVGKSRLLDEVGTLAMVQGALVLRGQAVEQGGGPYQLWLPTLRWLTMVAEPGEAERAVLDPILPVAGRPPSAADKPPSRSTQSRVAGVIDRLLADIGQPVVLILEDLQWAGSESLHVLAHLVQQSGGQDRLILASFRDEDRPDLPAALEGMHVLKLTRLADDAIADLSEAMLGAAGRDAQLVDLLQRETEGNVFFVIEVVRALAEEAGQLAQVGGMTLPTQVVAGGMERILRRRLDRVDAGDRDLLTIAAVYGRQVEPAVLQAIVPNADMDRWLSNCANVAVLEVQDGQWRFAHDRLRLAVLQGVSGGERKQLHQRVAAAMETMYADDPTQSAALSYHWAGAGDPEREQHYATVAGDYALRTGAFREALAFFQRALALDGERDSQEGAVETDSDRTRAIHLKRQIAAVHAGLGQYEPALRLYREALALCETTDNAAALADIHMSMGDVAYALETFHDAETYYATSLDIYEGLADRAGVVRALNSLGNVAYDLDDYNRANDLYKRSLALSRESGYQWGMAGSFGDVSASDDDASA